MSIDLALLSTAWLVLIALLTAAACILLSTWIRSTVNFHLATQRTARTGEQPTSPPLLPYIIPGLGSTIQFSNQTIGAFWRNLQRLSAKYGGLDAFSIILNGTRTHFIFSPAGIAAAFRAKGLSRSNLDRQLGVNALGMTRDEAERAFPSSEPDGEKPLLRPHRIHAEHLLSSSAVHSLTGKYIECLEAELAKDDARRHCEDGRDGDGDGDGVDVELYSWLRDRVFVASSTALCGSRLLEMHPDLDRHFWKWEEGMLGLLFGVPRLFAREAYAARDVLVRKLGGWLEDGYRRGQSVTDDDDDDPDWEPTFGARVMRRRHAFYQQQGLTIGAQAGYDLVFLAGILTNATPATGWLLMHILAPESESDSRSGSSGGGGSSEPSLRARILAELQTVQSTTDGSIDIPALTRLPLLNSAFHETLRLYVDLLVVRQVDSDATTLGHHRVKKSEMVMLPTWMTHHNASFFEHPDKFVPDRFVVTDAETGAQTCSTAGLGGTYFPFGGGAYMCPGRTFAKQEVLGTVAVLLLHFDVTFVEFAVAKGKAGGGFEAIGRDLSGFPALKRNYAGNQVVGIEGDMRVRIKRKEKKGLGDF